jgi:septum formation protein
MNLPCPLILASNSPRRKELLDLAGFNFTVEVRPIEETFPENLEPLAVATHIAKEKMKAYKDLANNNIVLCADTIVVQDGHILGKPETPETAYSMLKTLSGNTHEVITSVVIAGPGKSHTITEVTEVIFEDLNDEEIHHYIENFKPFDKAGSYGIQEWIGLIGIKEIHGSYFNVVGLPIHRVYQELKLLFN